MKGPFQMAKAIKETSAQKQPRTGAGPQPQVSSYSDIILDICGRDLASMEGITNAIKNSRASTSSGVDRQQPRDVEISPFEVKQTKATDGNDGKDTEMPNAATKKPTY